MAILGALAAVATQVVPQAVDSLTSKSSSSSGPCPRAPSPTLVATVLARTPREALEPLRQHWESVSKRAPFYQADPAALAQWIAGGDDCKHSDARGAQLEQYFWELARNVSTETQPVAPPPPTTSATDKLLDAGRQIVQSGVDVVTGVVQGAAAGAQSAAAAAGAASRSTAQTTSVAGWLSSNALVILAALVAVVVLLPLIRGR